MSTPGFRTLGAYRRHPGEERRRRVRSFRQETERRRTVPEYADGPTPRGIIEETIRAAGRAPSGANLQPRHVAVAQSDDVKRPVREAAGWERPHLLLVTGYPAGEATVPETGKKSLEEIATFIRCIRS